MSQVQKESSSLALTPTTLSNSIHNNHYNSQLIRLTGHDNYEHPWCQNLDTKQWEINRTAQLDKTDAKNKRDDQKHGDRRTIDRHSCVHMDVNHDKRYVYCSC